MANYIDRINAGLGVALRRQYESPLDVSTVFKSKQDFEAYVLRNTAYENSSYSAEENAFLNQINPYSYPGQIVGVIDESTNTATAYIINKAGPLEGGEDSLEKRYSQVGSAVAVDNKTISLVNGVLQIANIPGEITKVMQPTLQLNGSILWTEVSETTVEGLQALIQALTSRVDTLETSVSTIQDAYLKSVTYDSGTGIFTFTKQDGSTEQFDLAIEKVVTNFEYDPDTESLVLTLADGTTQSIPLTAFIKEYTTESNATQVQLNISETNEISASLVDGGITGSKLDASLLSKINAGNQAASDITNIQQSLSSAEADIDQLQIDVASKISANDLSTIVDGTTIVYQGEDGSQQLKVGVISGSQVSGSVAQANQALSADKVTNALTFGEKTFDGSAPVTLEAGDIGALTSVPVATSEILGGIKLGYSETSTNRAVQLDENNAAFVTIPEALQYTAGAGITLSGTEFSISENAITNDMIQSVDTNKLTQTSGEYLTLNGGNAGSFSEAV